MLIESWLKARNGKAVKHKKSQLTAALNCTAMLRLPSIIFRFSDKYYLRIKIKEAVVKIPV
jgi:hypothetical protein